MVKRVMVNLDDELFDGVQASAVGQGRSISNYIAQSLREYVLGDPPRPVDTTPSAVALGIPGVSVGMPPTPAMQRSLEALGLEAAKRLRENRDEDGFSDDVSAREVD